MRNRIIGSLLLAAALITGGCAALAPGADPLVVRVEQTQNVGFGTVKTFLLLDDVNRTEFHLNAGEVHQFAEHLREKVVVDGETNRLWVSVFKSLDRAKLAYKLHPGRSNDVYSALSAAEVILSQSQQYITFYNTKE